MAGFGVDILILDEPTRGVDVNAKQVIHNVVKKRLRGKRKFSYPALLRSSGGSRTADRAVILREGHTIGMIQKKDMTENSILIAANGGGRIRIMSEVNKNENATAPKVDTRKTEINKIQSPV